MKSLRQKTNYSDTGVVSHNVTIVTKDVKRLEKKIKSGTDHILTQQMYDEEKIAELGDATKQIDVPIFVGIMPLTSSKNAEFLHNEVPGIKLSDHVRERMQAVQGDRGKSTAESIAISKELIDAALEHFNGIYLITPF